MTIRYELSHTKRTEQFVPEQDALHLLKDGNLGFCPIRADHMVVMEYDGGWGDPRVVPYGDLAIAPGALVLNYGVGEIEGLKVFRHGDELVLFRPQDHAERFNASARRYLMPELPEEDFIGALEALVDVNRLWYPDSEGATLYLRPLMFSIDDSVAPQQGKKYQFVAFASPTGPYKTNGLDGGMKVLVTDKFHRAHEGGTGNVKGISNYAGVLAASEYARERGAHDVLYLDTANQHVEELSTSNFFYFDEEGLHLPAFNGNILPSITARSVIELAEDSGIPVFQERIGLADLVEKLMKGKVTSAGALGTAAVIAPISEIILDAGLEVRRDTVYTPPEALLDALGGVDKLIVPRLIHHSDRTLGFPLGAVDDRVQQLYDMLTGIQGGTVEDTHAWLHPVPHLLEPEVFARTG